jgi:dATP pyrophosphohydrolase
MTYKRPESVLVVIHTPTLEILLLERADHPGWWQSVTGSLEQDETPTQAARREVEEETGLVITPDMQVESLPNILKQPVTLPVSPGSSRPLQGGERGEASRHAFHTDHLYDWQQTNYYEIYHEFRYRYAPGVTHNVEHVFSLQVPAASKIRLAPKEHLHHCWMSANEAAERCFSPSNAAAIRQLQRIKLESL